MANWWESAPTVSLDAVADAAKEKRFWEQAQEVQPAAPSQPAGAVNREVADAVGAQLNALGPGIANGITFGFVDNLRGFGAGLRGLATGEGYLPAYQRERDNTRKIIADAREQFPGTYALGEIGGAVVPAIGTAPVAVGKGLMNTILRMGLVGGTEGALHGAGNADGQGLLAAIGKGALVGGGLGAAAVPAVGGLRAIGRGVGRAWETLASGKPSPTRAGAIIARTLDRAKMSSDDVAQAAYKAFLDGQPMYRAADALGIEGQRTLAGVARQPGEGRRELIEFLEQRQAGQGDRIGGFIEEALGVKGTAAQKRAALEHQRGIIADANYQAARDGAGAVDVRGALQGIDDLLGPYEAGPVATDSTGGILRQIRNRLQVPQDKLPEGVSEMVLSDFDAVLKVKRDLQDEIGALTRAGRNNAVRELTPIVKALDEALEQASAGYRAANDTFRDQSRVIDAIDLGIQAARPGRTEDALGAYRGLPSEGAPNVPALLGPVFDTPRQAFRQGYADPLMTKIETSPPGVNMARTLRTPKNEAMFAEMARDPDLWRRRLEREQRMFETRGAATGGSQTAENLADQTDVNAGYLVDALLSPGKSTLAAATDAAKSLLTGQGEATRKLIAEVLLSSDPKAALAPLLRKALMSDARTRAAEGVVRGYGRERLQSR